MEPLPAAIERAEPALLVPLDRVFADVDDPDDEAPVVLNMPSVAYDDAVGGCVVCAACSIYA